MPKGAWSRLAIPRGMALVPVIAVLGLAAGRVPVPAAAAAFAATVFAGAWFILRSPISAAAAAAPIALLAPWRYCPQASNMAMFSLGAAMLWLLWLWLVRPGAKAPNITLVALAAAAAAALSTTCATVVAASAVLYMLRGKSVRRGAVAAALLAPAAISVYFHWLGERLMYGASTFSLWRELLLLRYDVWSAPAWSIVSHTWRYDDIMSQFASGIQWTAVAAACVLLYPFRSRWWAPATFTGGAFLFLGAVFLGGNPHFHYSLPVEAALLVPAGIGGLARIAEQFPAFRRFAGRERAGGGRGQSPAASAASRNAS